jgi:hypothetical protein
MKGCRVHGAEPDLEDPFPCKWGIRLFDKYYIPCQDDEEGGKKLDASCSAEPPNNLLKGWERIWKCELTTKDGNEAVGFREKNTEQE